MVRMLFLVVAVTVPWLQLAFGNDDEEEMCDCIKFGITEDVVACKDFENKNFNVDLKMKLQEGKNEDDPSEVCLSGFIEMMEVIDDDYDIVLSAMKETEVGHEPVFTCSNNICKSMSDKDAPWWPVVEQINSTCPLPEKKYPIKNMKLKTDFADGALNSDFIGFYLIEIAMKKTTATDNVLCFVLGSEIYEKRIPCSDCPSAQRKKK